jgi:hypothetical protein
VGIGFRERQWPYCCYNYGDENNDNARRGRERTFHWDVHHNGGQFITADSVI